MSFWKRFTGVVLLLVAGFLAGATVSSSLNWNPAADGPRTWRHGPSPLAGLFYEELKLTDEQQVAVEEVLERCRSDLGEVRRTMAHKIHELMAQAAGDIEPLLDVEQRRQYEALVSGWQERHRNWEKQREQFRSRSEAQSESR
jgi:hypothetical protein